MFSGPSPAGCFAVLRYAVSDDSSHRPYVVALFLSRLDYRNPILPTRLLSRLLQSVLNAAARSVDRRSSSLGPQYWCSCQFSQATSTRAQIKFKLAVIVYRALHVSVPRYLSYQLCYVADLPTRTRSRLRSSTSRLLDVRPSRLVTVGDRSFFTAGPRLWNSLPEDTQSASSLATTQITFI